MFVRFAKSTMYLTIALSVTVAGSAGRSDASQTDAVQDDGKKEIKRITADEASKHISQKCIVEMRVKSSRHLADRGICFLNSQKNHRDKKNFTVVIRRAGLKAFKEKKIEQPAKQYRGKKIRVTGKIELYSNKRPQIIVKNPEQIEIVKPDRTDKKKKANGDESEETKD